MSDLNISKFHLIPESIDTSRVLHSDGLASVVDVAECDENIEKRQTISFSFQEAIIWTSRGL